MHVSNERVKVICCKVSKALLTEIIANGLSKLVFSSDAIEINYLGSHGPLCNYHMTPDEYHVATQETQTHCC